MKKKEPESRKEPDRSRGSRSSVAGPEGRKPDRKLKVPRARPRPAPPALQFLIVLVGSEPLVWRRIVVPGKYSFWDLHVAIQDAMGWTDHHLHEFNVPSPDGGDPIRIGIPDDEYSEETPLLASWDVRISGLAENRSMPIRYSYDFGDGWEHVLVCEGYGDPGTSAGKPLCIAGERACPPEDCGGLGGFARFLSAIADPDDPEHDSMLEWAGGRYDPLEFDPKQVHFDDPRRRWKMAFEEEEEY